VVRTFVILVAKNVFSSYYIGCDVEHRNDSLKIHVLILYPSFAFQEKQQRIRYVSNIGFISLSRISIFANTVKGSFQQNISRMTFKYPFLVVSKTLYGNVTS